MLSLRRLIITDITMGAPISPVTTLIGKAPSKPGIRAIKLQNKARTEPAKITAGNNTFWLVVRNKPLVRCGTARPKNAIGPQNAVIAAVRIPVHNKMARRVFLMFIPGFRHSFHPV